MSVAVYILVVLYILMYSFSYTFEDELDLKENKVAFSTLKIPCYFLPIILL